MILLQVFLILLNAVFASAEIAVISINDAKLARMTKWVAILWILLTLSLSIVH